MPSFVILTRQARDKHRENSKKDRFSSGSPPPELNQTPPDYMDKVFHKKEAEKHAPSILSRLFTSFRKKNA
jgi:hypothetical protein